MPPHARSSFRSVLSLLSIAMFTKLAWQASSCLSFVQNATDKIIFRESWGKNRLDRLKTTRFRPCREQQGQMHCASLPSQGLMRGRKICFMLDLLTLTQVLLQLWAIGQWGRPTRRVTQRCQPAPKGVLFWKWDNFQSLQSRSCSTLRVMMWFSTTKSTWMLAKNVPCTMYSSAFSLTKEGTFGARKSWGFQRDANCGWFLTLLVRQTNSFDLTQMNKLNEAKGHFTHLDLVPSH